MAVRRSYEMQLVGYALARCGYTDPMGGPSAPPDWLGAVGWKDAYSMFFPSLGDGRTADAFRNSLKNARDAFDAHVSSGRVGWVDQSGAPHRKDTMVGRILSEWEGKSDDALRQVVLEILDGGNVDQCEENEEGNTRTEGGKKLRLIRECERKSSLRRSAIAIHGTTCKGCGFDFENAYGDHGRGYIEVHHAMPLADYGERDTDPATDLTVLCANCHRMVHRRRGICLSLEELREKLASSSS